MHMASKVVRFIAKREKVERERAADLMAAVEAMCPPPALLVQLRRVVSRHTKPDASPWPGGFSMVSLEWIGRAWKAIDALKGKDRPKDVRRAFDAVLLNLSPDTGEVLLSRDELAEAMGVSPDKASAAMSVLVRLGLVQREYLPVEGMRGRGMVRYAINAHVAWNGSLRERQLKAAQQSLPLRLVHDAARGSVP